MDEYDPADQGYGNGGGDVDNESGYSQHEQDGANDDDDASDYDPSSFHFDNTASITNIAATSDERPISVVSQQSLALPPKPKTSAGFILEDSDDEDEEVEATSQQDEAGYAVSEAAPDISSVASAHLTDTAAPANSSVSLNGSPTVPVPDPATVQVPSTVVPPSPQTDPTHGKTSVSAAPAPQQLSTPQPETIVVAPPSHVETQQMDMPSSSAKRMPHDAVGRLEDRVREDPRGDAAGWISLINHYAKKGQLDHMRATYEKFFSHFPTSPLQWCQWVKVEIEHKDEPGNRVDQTLQEAFVQCLGIDLVRLYIEYVRRIHPLLPDPNGENRGIVLQAFEYTLGVVGNDPESGWLWSEYTDFVKAGPGSIGGTSWQDHQKVDQVRKAYQRAIKVPHASLAKLWKEYDHFENGLDRVAGRRFLQDQSPHYMTARSAWTQLEQILTTLDRMNIPLLPPLHGFDGEETYANHISAFGQWVEFEKRDELVLKDENISLYRDRILYAYTQATMALRFYPQIWFEAANWCLQQGTKELTEQGEAFLDNGIKANPESVLLALTKADRVELAIEPGNDDATAIANGQKLDVPFETAHTALYSLREKHMATEKKEKSRIEDEYAARPPDSSPVEEGRPDDSDDEDAVANKPKTSEQAKQQDIEAVQGRFKVVLNDIKQMISYLWVAKLRAFRRIQGQGVPNKPKKGFRGIFAEARVRGQLSSDVYIANALMEWHCYKDPAANKIFERGLKLFPTDEVFALEYVKHLISINDQTNARAVFETTITKISNTASLSAEQKMERCTPLYDHMYEFESRYGDLQQIHRLLGRMTNTLVPSISPVQRMAQRHRLSRLDGITCQIVISPTQTVPKGSQRAFDEADVHAVNGFDGMKNEHIRLGKNGPYVASPKRPLEDSEDDSPARKFMRGESPLKGAAGRRIQGHSATNSTHIPMHLHAMPEARVFPSAQPLQPPPGALLGNGAAGFAVKTFVPNPNLPTMPHPTFSVPTGPAPLAQDIKYLLSILPNPQYYQIATFDPTRMVDLLARVDTNRGMAGLHEPRFN